MMEVIEIVKKYLIENGYDGLCNPDIECGCSIDDLMPCDGNCSLCEPGYEIPADDEFELKVVQEKPT